MEPLTDFDRTLREAMRVEPGGNFTARIRTRVAQSQPESRTLIPRFTVAAVAAVLLTVVTATVWRETSPFVGDSVLPHRDLIVFSQAPRVVSSAPQLPPPHSRATGETLNVVVSRSEMLALQRLFSGLTVAPPATPTAEELSIPELTIEPIVPFPAGSEGERK